MCPIFNTAEREGFEPSRGVTLCHVSSVVLSAAQPPLHSVALLK